MAKCLRRETVGVIADESRNMQTASARLLIISVAVPANKNKTKQKFRYQPSVSRYSQHIPRPNKVPGFPV